MLSLLVRPLRQVVQVLLANDSPRQIAAGVAIGLMLGLAPKGNLIAVTLGVLLFSLRVNKSAGLAVAMAATWIGTLADPFFHRLGDKVLAMDVMQPLYVKLYDMPLGPWIGFNNTVVIGSLLVGLYLAYPMYLATRMLLDRYQQRAVKALVRFRIARALMGVDFSSRIGAGLGGGS